MPTLHNNPLCGADCEIRTNVGMILPTEEARLDIVFSRSMLFYVPSRAEKYDVDMKSIMLVLLVRKIHIFAKEQNEIHERRSLC